MQNTKLDTAVEIAERFRKNISNIEFHDFNVTVSLGVSQIDNEIDSDEKLIKRADFCLCQAKDNGKDRVEIYEKNNQ